MNKNNKYVLRNEDYVQSANCLFHFMSEFDFLVGALNRKALCPRYNIEDVEYLNIKNGKDDFKRIAVLQKCFCDIPLSSVFKMVPIELTDDNKHLTDEQKRNIPIAVTHYDLYGKYALGFNKKWGEERKIQPVHYLNDKSDCSTDFSEMINSAINEDHIPDKVADATLKWLSFLKPLRGKMKHIVETESHNKYEVEIFKNFHDEHEWRYVPTDFVVDGNLIDSVIAKSFIVSNPIMLKNMSNDIMGNSFASAWLSFKYADIRYIIVPDKAARTKIIKTIMNLDGRLFNSGTIKLQKNLLISKILVLEELEKDL